MKVAEKETALMTSAEKKRRLRCNSLSEVREAMNMFDIGLRFFYYPFSCNKKVKSTISWQIKTILWYGGLICF